MTKQSDHIPFLDLVGLHSELKDELTEVFRLTLDTAGFIGGPMVQSFEEHFATYCDARHAVGVGSGTDALRFALLAVGVRPGDIVITVPNTFIATTEAISQAGARPLFVDIDERTYNLDVDRLREFIATCCEFDPIGGNLFERGTRDIVRAIIPVHLYGQMADMDPLLEIAGKYNLTVIEDASQAHGAEYYSHKEKRWRKAGSMGRAAAFSFYPGKNLGACGEAGAVTTNDPELAKAVRMLRDHGQAKKYYHDIEGYNGRLDALQAGILKVKLAHLPKWTEQRQTAAATYNRLLAPLADDLTLPYEPEWSRAVYHIFAVRTKNRPLLQGHLDAHGIGTGIHYPIPLHLQTAYRHLGYQPGAFPVAEAAACEVLSLPMFPGLSLEAQTRVASSIADILDTNGRTNEGSAVEAQLTAPGI